MDRKKMPGYNRMGTFSYEWKGLEEGYGPTDEMYSMLALCSLESMPRAFWVEHGDDPGLGGLGLEMEREPEEDELEDPDEWDEQEEDEWEFPEATLTPLYFFYN